MSYFFEVLPQGQARACATNPPAKLEWLTGPEAEVRATLGKWLEEFSPADLDWFQQCGTSLCSARNPAHEGPSPVAPDTSFRPAAGGV